MAPERLPRFFADGTFEVDDVVRLGDGDGRKLKVVLRARVGDYVEVCESAGRTYRARVESLSPAVSVRLAQQIFAPEAPRIAIVLAQAIPKGAKMDFVIEKATELGVSRIQPVLTERVIATVPSAKIERWRRLARTAAQQCGRSDVPLVGDPVEWRELVAGFGAVGVALVPWELATRVPLRDRLGALLEGVSSSVVAIGPEGGLSEDEVELARAAGAEAISLGDRILRTETAGLVLVSAMRYVVGEL